jgi:hypothetical protein
MREQQLEVFCNSDGSGAKKWQGQIIKQRR